MKYKVKTTYVKESIVFADNEDQAMEKHFELAIGDESTGAEELIASTVVEELK